MGRSRRLGAANRSDGGRSAPPFPAKQMFVLACCRICEPIAFMSIFPYIYYMIEDFNITDDTNKIAVYAGMVTSAFTLAEFSTGVLWGRLSDKIGRKPVLLSGLIGTALSVLAFGFAPNLPVALFARALGGLLNGNIGVLQTTVAELVTVKEQQPRAYTIMPMVWCIGSIIGPMIGGALARPCISYPEIFARGTIWDKYPYLLPNLFSAATVFVGVIIGLLFLDETHADKKSQRDRGREMGNYLAQLFGGVTKCNGRKRGPEKQALLDGEPRIGYMSNAPSRVSSTNSDDDEALPAYQSQENSPRLSPQADTRSLESAPLEPASPIVEQERKQRIFTKPVIMNIMSYGILAFHTMTFDQLFPVFLSTSRPEHPILELPFRFTDGFGLETKTIGVIMSVQGVYSLLSNYLIVPPVTRRLGSLRLFRMLAFSYFALYLVTPYLVLLPETMRMPAIYLLVIWKCTFSTMAYPSNAILLANSAPSKQVLGTINGIAASTASLCRALGPTLSGLLYSLGLQTGYSGLAWWFSGLITIAGAYLSSQITEGGGYHDVVVPEEEDPLLDEGLFTDYDGDDDRV
ncbi:major facilitator superfamily domain-containing protein [Ilyonectria robusta]|uniref:major facilitator superfamily domain-containing protein n=1 Tax=Ilyonectria robusta TaxID=1079257 RepID=UPI001E8D71E0|nr:major facilitator superfamily domain-containing protein [Ilyonectria robusta]KAH6996236.1 major facilitator superfamily domain-containing protein [Ilyonectria sp. MPI-CAGE-AT-0026]KAH8735881.1 major facilitator superfamily domain-containing protein [Ilyonectria robusta]